MWDNATTEVRKSYSKEYLMSLIPRSMGTWPPNDDVTPVVKAIEHALTSSSPKTRYLVDGYGSKISFIDEYAVYMQELFIEFNIILFYFAITNLLLVALSLPSKGVFSN